eukprot:528749-Pyramimonas_sp.AAC.1
MPTLPASDWSAVRIYPRFLRLIGRKARLERSHHELSIRDRCFVQRHSPDRCLLTNRTQEARVYSHGGPIRRMKRGYILVRVERVSCSASPPGSLGLVRTGCGP